MYFHESEVIAAENQDLRQVVEEVDEMLATIFTAAPLRPGDFSCKLACDMNQVAAVFDLLAEQDVLLAEGMVECGRCQNLMSAAAFREACDDGDDFECSSCERPIRPRTPVTTVYRMTVETLARPRPAVATPDIESALREFDQYSSVFRRLAQIWVIKHEGRMILMKDAVGLRHLSRLLAEPERIIPAAFLIAAEAGIDPRILAGTSEKVIDDQAMAEYKQKYAELEEELKEAENRNDQGRIPKLQAELDAIGTQIISASGFGGKTREKSDAERARKNVSTSVTRAIDSIRDEHPRLGKHLHNSVSRGLALRYAPEHDPGWLT